MALMTTCTLEQFLYKKQIVDEDSLLKYFYAMGFNPRIVFLLKNVSNETTYYKYLSTYSGGMVQVIDAGPFKAIRVVKSGKSVREGQFYFFGDGSFSLSERDLSLEEVNGFHTGKMNLSQFKLKDNALFVSENSFNLELEKENHNIFDLTARRVMVDIYEDGKIDKNSEEKADTKLYAEGKTMHPISMDFHIISGYKLIKAMGFDEDLFEEIKDIELGMKL